VLRFGYNTGDLIFAGYYDSITVSVGNYIPTGDTIWPGDTIYSPNSLCDSGLFIICTQVYTADDFITLPCDSVFTEEIKWASVWRAEGMSLQEFYDSLGTYSRRVMIPILDSARFYRKDFRFRFKNYASIRNENIPDFMSNEDQWNVDYIYLNIGRHQGDTIFRDVTFAERAPSILKRYQSMPFKQFLDDITNETKASLDLYITNLSDNIYNTQFESRVYDENHNLFDTYDGGFCNLFPFADSGYQECEECPRHACPRPFTLFGSGDSAYFRIDYTVLGDFTPVDTIGDTVTFHQRFFNYYAYDDGIPERGYGVKGPNAKGAVRFDINTRDTLRAVRIYFNHTVNNVNQQYFNLKVWQDNNGIPGEELYSQPSQYVEYSKLNSMATYMLDEPFEVNGTIYVGWERVAGNKILNIGLDMNNNQQDMIFYNDGEWASSLSQGSLMIRPVLGADFDPFGISDPAVEANGFGIYPNPSNGNEIHIQLPEYYNTTEKKSDLSIRIYNILGQSVMESAYQEKLNVSALDRGVYFMQLMDNKRSMQMTNKLIISR